MLTDYHKSLELYVAHLVVTAPGTIQNQPERLKDIAMGWKVVPRTRGRVTALGEVGFQHSD